MKFENSRVFNFEGAFVGMRNPLESWSKSDSIFGMSNKAGTPALLSQVAHTYDPENAEDATLRICWLEENGLNNKSLAKGYDGTKEYALIGAKDLDLARRLINSGDPSHRKFLRQIMVSVDITAPIYW